MNFFRKLSRLAALAMITSPLMGEEKPNIILIMADDLGWGDVGFNGHEIIKTPHLDEMAENGLRMDRFYVASPLCSPARGSCLTGRHPWRYGILAAHTGGMRIGEFTVAEVARLKKYQTGFFGKWHLGWVKPEDVSSRGHYSPPWHHGFEETFATTGAVPTWDPGVVPEGWAGRWGGGDSKVGGPWKGGKPYVHNGEEVTENLKGDDSRIIMDRVIPFINQAAKKKDPFLACVWFHTPHEPVVAGPEYRKLYPDSSSEEKDYFGCITAMDEQIGRLRAELRKLGIENNTVLFFTSDNGPSGGLTRRGVASAGPFRGSKHTMYEGGLRVPSLVEWPGKVKAGSVSQAVTATVDYFPTVVDLTGVKLGKKANRPIDGVSLLPLMEGGESEREEPLFFGYRRLYNEVDGQALTEERYKLIRRANKSGKYELYDLLEDPAEKKNLAKSHPEVFERMKKAMAEQDESCRLSRDGADYQH